MANNFLGRYLNTEKIDFSNCCSTSKISMVKRPFIDDAETGKSDLVDFHRFHTSDHI